MFLWTALFRGKSTITISKENRNCHKENTLNEVCGYSIPYNNASFVVTVKRELVYVVGVMNAN